MAAPRRLTHCLSSSSTSTSTSTSFLRTPPTARFFLTLASPAAHQSLTAQQPQHTLPSFLVPWPLLAPRSRAQLQLQQQQQHRPRPETVRNNSFARLSRRYASTTTIYNPRRDENGQDMSVEITARAAQRLKEIMRKDANPNLALRITVESGGCHGFQYLMSLTTLPALPPAARNDTAADLKDGKGGLDDGGIAEEDTVFEVDEAKVVMDEASLELLKGSKVDYTMELIGSQFKIVDNPLATSSCGCGTSFDIKI